MGNLGSYVSVMGVANTRTQEFFAFGEASLNKARLNA